MSDHIERMRELLALAAAASKQLTDHHQDKRRSKPPFDEWWGPAAIQDAASFALEVAPLLLDVADAARSFRNGGVENALANGQRLEAALNALSKPSP